MKNFVEQIFWKNRCFLLNERWIWYKVCCRQVQQNIGKISVEIGRYSKGQISADNISALNRALNRYIGRSLDYN